MNLFVLLIIFHFLSYSKIMMNVSPMDDAHQGSNTDRVSLLAVKSEITHDPHRVLDNWNESVPHCQWYGVTCGAKVHRRVVALILESKNLVGTLSPFVSNLSFLHYLDLFNNTFQGHIPTQIGHLHKLRSLNLELNSFTGLIPSNISRCSNLELLGLAGNKLSGTIPPQLSLLTNLRVFQIHDNMFTGNPFDIVVNMTFLQSIGVSTNFFQGSIPQSMGQFRNLLDFAVAENKLSGSIPTSLYNLSSLQAFDVQLNQLEGTIPSDIGFRLPQLKYLGLSANFFHGHVPNSISNLTHIEQLEIYSNNFTGKFMFDATNMPNLDIFDISMNYLGVGDVGDLTFLETLSNCSQLRLLILFSNNFGGELPLFRGNWSTKLKAIEVYQNHITGEIPTDLFNLINLKVLDLNENQLSGYLPPEIGNVIELEQFSCTYNNLLGSIPHSIGNLSKLSALLLDGNNFEGAIPSSLGNCTNLLYLHLPQNNLTGSVPSHLFQASMLVEIRLSHNHLQGTIPQEIGHLKNLVKLDLSTNAFTGNIPSSLSSCVGLLWLLLDKNFFTGSIPLSFESLKNIQLLNLSQNILSGKLLDFLCNFPLIQLDISSNNFEGEVPTKGVFRNLSAISVSGNPNLCGGIDELHLPRCPAKNTTKPKRRRLSHHAVIVIIAISSFAGSLSIALSVFLVLKRRKRNDLGEDPSLKEALPKVSYNTLYKATNGFSEANLVGTGHFGCVYKGILDQERTVVAVKVIKVEEEGASKSFLSECKALRNTRHRNLVKIVTVCSSTDSKRNDFKALVYEFMPNGNLEQWIHEDRDRTVDQRKTLSLEQRLNIAIDVGNALDYLHNGCENPIIHCDLKPSNILVDDQMVAHVGDFGLARFLSNSGTSITSSVFVKGTVGYAAPEYGLGSMVSKEGDVYSYGIVLIELMTAIKPTDSMFTEGLNLHEYAKLALPDQLPTIIDEILLRDDVGARHGIQYKYLECIQAIIETGLKCSAESPQDRISMENAIGELRTIRNIFL